MSQKNLLRKFFLLFILSAFGKQGFAIECTLNPVPATCVNSSLNLSLSEDPGSGVTYTWEGPGISTATTFNTTATPTVSGLAVYSVTITGGGVGSCSVAATYTVGVTINSLPPSPTGTLTLCENGGTVVSVAAGPGIWSSSDNGVATIDGSGNVTGVSPGTTTISFKLTATQCVSTVVATVNVAPSGHTATASPNPVCQGATLNLAANPTALVTFSWSGPNSFSSTLANNNINNTQVAAAGVYTLVVSNSFACSETVFSQEVVVNGLSAAASPNPICEGNNLALGGTIIGGAWASSFSWTGPGTGALAGMNQSIASVTTANAGVYTLTASDGGSCTVSATTSAVVVNSAVTAVNPSVTNSPLCDGGHLDLAGGVTGGTNVSYSWSGPDGFTSSLLNPTIPVTSTANTGNYELTATAGGCTGVTNSVNVTVNPLPSVFVAGNEGSNIFCNQALHDDIVLQSNDESSTFVWSNDRPSVGIAAAGVTSTIPGFVLTNTGFTDSTATISVIATSTVTTCQSNVFTYTLTVRPTPSISSGSHVFCNGASASVHFAAVTDPSITDFSWTSDNSDVGIGGTDDVDLSFTATNAGVADVVTIFTVHPVIGACNGPDSIVTVTVHPTPVITATLDRQKCNGDTINVSFSGATSPLTRYTWGQISPLSVGLVPGQSAGDVSFSFTDTNSSNVTRVAQYFVTDSIGACAGVPDTFSYTVFPTPHTTNLSDHTYCNGFAVPSLLFTNSVSEVTPTYFWFTNNQDIFPIGTRPSYISVPTNNITGFIATDTFTAVASSTIITVVATAHGCTDTVSETLNVNPVPTVNTVSNLSYNQGDAVPSIIFSGIAESFPWTGTTTVIGAIAASGTDSIGTFTALASGEDEITVTPTIMSTDGACAGSSMSFTISVKQFVIAGLHNPVTVSGVRNDTVCNGTTYDSIKFVGGVSGTTYNWSFTGSISTTLDVLSNNPGDTLTTFTVNNPTLDYVTDTFTVTPTAGGSSVLFTITVRPSATITVSNQDQSKCNGSLTDAISFTPTTAASTTDLYTFSWTNSDVATLNTTASGSGSSIGSFSVTNAGNSATTGQIIVTPSIAGCEGSPVTITVTVNPTPVLDPALRDTAFCNNQNLVHLLSSPTDGLDSFLWVRDTIDFITNSADSIAYTSTGTFNIAEATQLHNSDDFTHPVVYNVSLKTAAGCINTVTVIDSVFPTPRLKINGKHSQCNGQTFVDPLESFTPGASFAWTMLPSNITHTNPSGTTTTISDVMTNATTITQSVVFTTTVTANGCANPGQTDTVFVKPSNSLITTHDTSVCSDNSFHYVPEPRVTDDTVSYTWVILSDASDTNIYFSNPAGTGEVFDTIITTRFSHIADVIKIAYTLSITDGLTGSCTDHDTVTVQVKPTAQKPTIIPPSERNFCNGLKHQNFSSINSNLDATLRCAWSVSPGIPAPGNTVDSQQSPFATNALISFGGNTSVAPTVTDQVWVNGFHECASASTYNFSDSAHTFDVAKTAADPNVFLYKDNATLFCDDNTVLSYQWGYDRKDSLTPHVLYDKFQKLEKNQDCLFDGVTDENFFNHVSVTDNDKLFWVKTSQVIGSIVYVQKSYLGGVAQKPGVSVSPVMTIYPNPAHADLSFELTGATGDNLTVEIYDMLGKKIESASLVNNNATISINDIPNGTFIAVCRNNGQIITSSHFVKN